MEALGINVNGLIAQIINFLLLLVLLRVLLYKPILNMLDQRAARVRESIANAEAIKQRLALAQQEYAEQVDRGRREGQVIIAQAMKVADRVRDEAKTQAQQEAEHFLTRARAEIELDKRRAVAELREQVADLAIMAAGKVVGRTLDTEGHRRIIQEVLSQSKTLD